MKNFLMLCLVTSTLHFFSANEAKAQSGWSTSRYYSEAGSSSKTCGSCFMNAYGYVIRNCQQRNWYTVNTCSNVYYWNFNTNSWYYQYQCGYWWTFSWNNFWEYCY